MCKLTPMELLKTFFCQDSFPFFILYIRSSCSLSDQDYPDCMFGSPHELQSGSMYWKRERLLLQTDARAHEGITAYKSHEHLTGNMATAFGAR